MTQNFKGKGAVITGASSGLEKAAALHPRKGSLPEGPRPPNTCIAQFTA